MFVFLVFLFAFPAVVGLALFFGGGAGFERGRVAVFAAGEVADLLVVVAMAESVGGKWGGWMDVCLSRVIV